jgi:hypothetical protein
MIWAGCFEKLFDVIGKLLRLVLRITLGDGDELLVGVASVLVIIALITSGGDRDSLWSSLRPPLIASSTPPCTLVGCLGWRPDRCWGPPWCCSTQKQPRPLPHQRHAWGRCRGVLLWPLAGHNRVRVPGFGSLCQTRMPRSHRRRKSWGVRDTFERSTGCNPVGIPLLLSATLQIPGIAGPHVCELKVAGENLLEIHPTID